MRPHLARCTAVAVSLALATSALAIVAPDHRPEPIRPTSVEPVLDAGRQAALGDGNAAWNRLLADHGDAWTVLWEPRNATVRSFQGSGVPMLDRASRDLDELEQTARGFLGRYGELFGVEPSALRRGDGTAFHGGRGELGLAEFDQYHAGLPVLGGHVSLRVKLGRLIQARASTFPGIEVDVAPTLDVAEAARIAADDARSFATDVRAGDSGELAILPIGTAEGFDFRLVWQLEVEADLPLGRWSYRVDAHDGTVLGRINRVVHVSDGTVTGEVSSRWPQDPTILVPLEGVEVTIGAEVVETDATGFYGSALDGTQTRTVELQGSRVDVENRGGDNARVSATGDGTVDIQVDTTNARLDETSVAHWVVQINNEGQRWLSLPWMDTPLPSNVNRSNFLLSCNAAYDGNSISFYPGAFCENSGEFADIIAHEWGHAIDDNDGNGIRSGGFSEGFGDVMSMIVTDECELAPGFIFGAGIRNNCDICPQSQCTSFFDPHRTGQIYASASWCVRNNLIDSLGEAAGLDKWKELTFVALPMTLDIDDSYEAHLVADDDDGNLANGTPNLCAINDCYVQAEVEEADPSCEAVLPALSAQIACDAGPFGPGGAVPVDITVGNLTAQSQTASLVVNGVSGGGELILLQRNLTLSPSQSVSQSLSLPLPASLPAGDYTLRLDVTDSNALTATDSCSFSVQ